MTDPRRLLDEDDLSEVERRLLRAALEAAPPPELVAGIWTELTIAVGAAGAATSIAASAGQAAAKASVAPGAGSATTAAATGGKLAVLKALAVGAAVGAVTTGGTALLTAPSRSPHPTTDAAHRAAPERRSSPARTSEATHGGARPVDPSANTPPKGDQPSQRANPAGAVPTSAVAEPTSNARLSRGSPPAVAGFETPDDAKEDANAGARTEAARTEARLVGVAREALRRHDAASALGVLTDVERRFPNGILQQEREALTISALAAMGRRNEASARAREFLRAFPNSPHAERVRGAIGER